MNKKFQNAALTILNSLAWISAVLFPICLIALLLDYEEFLIYSTIASFCVFISSVATHIVLQAALLYIEKNKKEGK